MKLTRIASAIALAAIVGSPLTASAQWAFDAPYWKEQLSRPANAEAPPTTVRPSGAAIVESSNAERATLEQAGFPQFTE